MQAGKHVQDASKETEVDLGEEMYLSDEEKAVDTYQGQDHKRGPAPRPKAVFQSESTQLIEDIDS